jgi:hypothetical protein
MYKLQKTNFVQKNLGVILIAFLFIFINNAVAKAVPKSEPTQCIYPGPLGGTTLYNNSYVALKSDIKTPIQMCEYGSSCRQDTRLNNGKATCVRSITNKKSPYYNYGCGTYTEHILFPTNLEIDCRCRVTGTGHKYLNPNDKNTDPMESIINCQNPTNQMKKKWPVKFGKGPKFDAWRRNGITRWTGGIFRPQTREFFSVIRWSDSSHVYSGSIVAWNIDTKSRRVVTGLYPDRRRGMKDFGSGYLSEGVKKGQPKQPLTGPSIMKWGNDGMIYLLAGGTGEGTSTRSEIIKINPDTGERSLVWKAQNAKHSPKADEKYGQCYRPDGKNPKERGVGTMAMAFEVGPKNEFYLSMHDVRAGDGILKISPDAKTCTPISVWGTAKGHNPGGKQKKAPAYKHVGKGKFIQFPVKGMLYHEDPEYGPMIYGVSKGDIYSFALEDGFRALETFATGTYKGMGHTRMVYMEKDGRPLIMATGNHAGSHVVVELGVGTREPLLADTVDNKNDPIFKSAYGVARSVNMNGALGNVNRVTYGGVMIDPKNPDIAYGVLGHGALVQLELSTFNSMIWSY